MDIPPAHTHGLRPSSPEPQPKRKMTGRRVTPPTPFYFLHIYIYCPHSPVEPKRVYKQTMLLRPL